MYVDLHCHSHYSDGEHSPKEICARAKRLSITTLALTDHNTIAGVPEMRHEARKSGIAFIPGIELYARYRRFRLHVLGYGFDMRHEELLVALERLHKRRVAAIHKSLTALKASGFIYNAERLFDTPSQYIGFGKIIHELTRSPHNRKKIRADFRLDSGLPDFFTLINRYFRGKRNSTLEETSLPVREAIGLLWRAGAITSLAHPGHHFSWSNDKVIAQFKAMGLQGLEVYSPYHNWHQVAHYQSVAQSLRLLATGGTDYHVEATYRRHPEFLGSAGEYFRVPKSVVKPFLEKISKR